MSALERHPRPLAATQAPTNLADVLERVLDKGVVIAGDIAVNLLDIELLTIKLRLLIASADTAQAMGLDWWTGDPFLSRSAKQLERENEELRERLERLERMLGRPSEEAGNGSPAPEPARAHEHVSGRHQ